MIVDKAKFYASARTQLIYGPTLDASELAGTEAVLAALTGLPRAWQAYALATAFWETARTMQPVVEAYWLSEDWRKKNLRYYPWHGRGYVQLTWDYNYELADKKLDLNGALIANPELAKDPTIAAKIMRIGMIEGWFSGDNKGRHSFARHLPTAGNATQAQFEGARRIINGVDKRKQIALLAINFQRALAAAGVA
jgi:putative chitinase